MVSPCMQPEAPSYQATLIPWRARVVGEGEFRRKGMSSGPAGLRLRLPHPCMSGPDMCGHFEARLFVHSLRPQRKTEPEKAVKSQTRGYANDIFDTEV